MLKRIKTNKKKGFTLIELIVVMAVLAILVLLAAPKFLGHTKEAQFTKHINNAKVLEDASERYYIDHGKWPRGADAAVYTPEEVASYAERIYDITGEELTLEEGNYWDIDYSTLQSYAKLPDESERANYVLRNPIGKVFYLDELTGLGKTRLAESDGITTPEPTTPKELTPEEINALPHEEWVAALEAKGYVVATDADFTKDTEDNWRYTGTDEYVIIPHEIGGVLVRSFRHMFRGDAYQGLASSPVKGVASDNLNVTDMGLMFYNSKGTSLIMSNFDTSQVTNMEKMFFNAESKMLDLSNFDTSNVTNMSGMFYRSQATTLKLHRLDTSNVTNMSFMFAYSQADTLDLSGFNTAKVLLMNSMFQECQTTTLDLSIFDTSNVTMMGTMFANSQAKTLDLSSFDTSRVTYMGYMFYGSQATTLDLSSFDTSQVTNMSRMFENSKATVGIARTTKDANIFNRSGTFRPAGLTFIVK